MTVEDPELHIRIRLVAAAATLSLAGTSALFIYVLFLAFLSSSQLRFVLGLLTRPSSRRQSQRLNELESWAKQKLAFIHTPFGIMFMNLVLADLIQALGFGLNHHWAGNFESPCLSGTCARTCTFQGVLIQLGDVASAFSNLMIAIQTYVILIFSWRLPIWSAWASILVVWISSLLLANLPPTLIGGWSGERPFYAWTGAWCWINELYSPLRLYLHYVWLFFSAFSSIILYGHLFWHLRRHFRNSGGLNYKDCSLATYAIRKRLERRARAMLIYPIAFMIMIGPLSAFRVASLAGHDWGTTAAAVSGSLYCLTGFVDVLIFGITRSIIGFPALGEDQISGTSAKTLMMYSLGTSASTASAVIVKVMKETVIDLDESVSCSGKHYSRKSVEKRTQVNVRDVNDQQVSQVAPTAEVTPWCQHEEIPSKGTSSACVSQLHIQLA
ncbi:hypothetical protein CROQUDRAFT_62973 [Cronartium quercuum f. sp. fusiforme G11]|uniref:G protein-coupled receptor GPR1/2/3 C-terminal domain-containing protein n=1 Tax=Cronartium quercuum f. sp. fusiforme G11 TaxID=708437 RepID=A0A9P6NI45_9BASI|nr:hypothetical protein CROQUDRAFT_62973 [Cronartium quercuum f. sp. fusiforme G11]